MDSDNYQISLYKEQSLKIEWAPDWRNRAPLYFVRDLPERKYAWNAGKPFWYCPATPKILERILKFRPNSTVTPEVQALYGASRQAEVLPDIPDLDPRLLPYQREGVQFIEKHNGHCLIADEMGLGKTVQALAWLNRHPKLRPVIILCPASLKLNWEREANKWMDEPMVSILESHPNEDAKLKKGMIYIINYDVLSDRKMKERSAKDRLEMIEFAEAHLPLYANHYPEDQFIIQAIQSVRGFVEEKTTRDEMVSACDAVREVVKEIAKDIKKAKKEGNETLVKTLTEVKEIAKSVAWASARGEAHTIKGWLDPIRQLHPKLLICDEVQQIRNQKAMMTKMVLMLTKSNTRNFLALTGTPIVNRPIEFWTTLHILDPENFPKYHTFGTRYCGAYHGAFGWNYNGVSRAAELHDLVFGRLAIRRRKADVLKELPPKRRVMVPMKIDNQGEYNKAKADIVNWITATKGLEAGAKASRIEALARLNTLKQLTAKGKLASVKEWIETFLESGEKLVAFTTHHAIIDELFEQFKKVAVKIDGRTSQEERDKAVQAFQNDDKVRVLFGNIKAAGVGLTLTAASNTAFVELGWSPGEHSQAEDRTVRIGQTATSITMWYLIANGTIEEWMAKLIDSKQKVLDEVVEGRESDGEDMLTSLLEQLKGEE
jgi:SNF2 family DNA or RNA helicase